MSNLKHLNLEQLYEAEKEKGKFILFRKKRMAELTSSIKYHRDSMNGQIERLQWIRKYITKKLDDIGYKDIGLDI